MNTDEDPGWEKQARVRFARRVEIPGNSHLATAGQGQADTGGWAADGGE